MENLKPKLLLHTCCIGCGGGIVKDLEPDFQITLYFYNPNIFPKEEYNIRLEETKKIAQNFGWKIIIEKADHQNWRKLVKNYEQEPERGKRCKICYRERLEKAREKAIKLNFDYFASTLTISPHKDAEAILAIGAELEKQNSKIKFLARDFKKQDGFKRAAELSRELNLYRQSYCGCEFSKRK